MECSGLTSISIPNGVTKINQSVFSGCRGLSSVTIPDSVTSIESSAFYYCINLTGVRIPDSVTRIRRRAFGYCTSLTDVTIPDSVTDFGEEIFYEDNNIQKLYIGSDIGWTFEGYASLKTVVIGEGFTSIPARMFYDCTGLTSADIPESVTDIGERAFANCSNLTSLTIRNPDVYIPYGMYWNEDDEMDEHYGICENCSSELVIYGWSESSARGYAIHEGITFRSLGVYFYPQGWCGSNVRYSYDSDTRVLTISGSGTMEDYEILDYYYYKDELY